MSKVLRKTCSSVGSDESGIGGLFGGFTVAAFRLTKDNLKKLQQHSWFEKIKDAKELSEEEVIHLAKEIKTALGDEGTEDFNVITVAISAYNESVKLHKSHKSILCSKHNELHRKLENKYTVHLIDNFLRTEEDKYSSRIIGTVTNIDKFIVKGDKQILSIIIASILATAEYLKHLREITGLLNINLNCRENHYLPVKSMEQIFEQLESQGKSRDYVYTNFCKKNIVKKYKKNLKNHQFQKDK